MKYYPINLDIRGRRCLVVGGGSVATRKVHGLVNCGAAVQVVSPEFTKEIEELAAAGKITLTKRGYCSADLSGMFLVIGATSDGCLNRNISAEAARLNMLCNIADLPAACNFILPAVVERGDLIIAVSTSGSSPAFAREIRRELERRFGEEYAELLRLMGAIRKRLLGTEHAPEAHKPLFEALISGGLLEKIRAGDEAEINMLLNRVLGEGFQLDSLQAQYENEQAG